MGAPERVADGPVRRVNLAAVETSLRRLQQQLARDGSRDPMDDRVVDNMLAGYGFVDALVADGVQVFAMGNLKHLLELNTVVLCGTSPARRDLYAGHIQATERRFYEERHAGIEDVIEWHAGHAGASSWERAAGVYVQMLSRPQLFIEGNHRTGALVMSYILMQGGEPPFVLTVDNAAAYFDPSAAIRDADKNGPARLFRLPVIRQRLAALLRDSSDRRYLLP